MQKKCKEGNNWTRESKRSTENNLYLTKNSIDTKITFLSYRAQRFFPEIYGKQVKISQAQLESCLL